MCFLIANLLVDLSNDAAARVRPQRKFNYKADVQNKHQPTNKLNSRYACTKTDIRNIQ